MSRKYAEKSSNFHHGRVKHRTEGAESLVVTRTGPRCKSDVSGIPEKPKKTVVADQRPDFQAKFHPDKIQRIEIIIRRQSPKAN